MKFMLMHKMTAELETGLPPDAALMEAIGQLMEQAMKDKIMLAGEGLKPTSTRVRLAYENGKRTIANGPFPDGRQLIAGFALMRVKSKDEAIAWCDRFANAIGDVALYLGPVVEMWDLGFAPKPDNPPLRFLAMHEMDANSENEVPPDPAMMAKMGALVEEMTKAGVLEATAGLTSTKKGARIHFDGGKKTVIDGPFAESKELVAGYAIVELPSKAAAIEFGKRFGEIVKVHEVEIRQVAEF
jgi:hypothetical protein